VSGRGGKNIPAGTALLNKLLRTDQLNRFALMKALWLLFGTAKEND
jgi:hypothetical protein